MSSLLPDLPSRLLCPAVLLFHAFPAVGEEILEIAAAEPAIELAAPATPVEVDAPLRVEPIERLEVEPALVPIPLDGPDSAGPASPPVNLPEPGEDALAAAEDGLAAASDSVPVSSSPDFEAPVPSLPSGFNSMRFESVESILGLGGFGAPSLRDGWSFGANLSGTYDSNVRDRGTSGQDDFIMNAGLSANYRSGGRDFQVFFGGGVNYSQYFSRSEFSGFGYNFSFGASYDGPKLDATLTVNPGLARGNNRYYGNDQVENKTFSTNLSLSYDLGPKTFLSGNLAYQWTDPNGSRYGATESFNAGLSAMWRYSPLLSIGPGVRYSYQSGDLQRGRESVGPTLSASYKASAKVALNGSIGWNFAEYGGSGGGSHDSFFCSIGASYRISDLWGVSLTVHKDTSADGARAGAYRDTFGINASVSRSLPQGSLSVGVGYENSDQLSTAGGNLRNGDLEYYTLNVSYNRPVFADRANAGLFFSWRETDGNAAISEEGYQIGASLSMGF